MIKKSSVCLLDYLFRSLILGATLPKIMHLASDVDKSKGTSVIVQWAEPKDSRKVAWKYGIYDGVNMKELLGQGMKMYFKYIYIYMFNHRYWLKVFSKYTSSHK